MPSVLSRLLPPLASAYALQAAFGLVFIPQQNERFFDLCGSLGFLSTSFVSLYYPQVRESFFAGRLVPFPALSTFAPRQLIITAAIGIWSSRLAVFLTKRSLQAGGDSRFDEIKKSPARFTFSWMAQATWVFLVGLPVYLTQVMPPALHPALGRLDYAAIGLVAGSFILENVADWQKSVWRADKKAKKHDEKFITSGLWGISRHPNYLGEVGVWTGMWALSASALKTAYFPRGTLALAAVSPLFTYFIIRKLSGIPPLEKAGDKKFGDDPKWKEYKERVPVLFPFGPKD